MGIMADMMDFIIGIALAIFVFGALIGPIADNTVGRQGVGNVTGATSTLLGIVPIMAIVGVLILTWKQAKKGK